MCQSCVIVRVTAFADKAPSFVTQSDALSDGDSIGERTAQVAWLNECVVKGDLPALQHWHLWRAALCFTGSAHSEQIHARPRVRLTVGTTTTRQGAALSVAASPSCGRAKMRA